MKKVVVFTDSTSDLEPKMFQEYDFDYIMNTFRFETEEKEYDARLDWKVIDPKNFYKCMQDGVSVKTSMIKHDDCEQKFKDALSKGYDVLYVACSSKLSGSVNVGKMIAEELLEKYPGRKIYCMDSLRSNYSEGLIAIKAAQMANEGASLEEIVKVLEDTKLNYQTYATVGSLSYLAKAGRIKAGKAFFGNLMGVKPIVVSDAEGNNFAFEKKKGRRNALEELVNIISTRIIKPEEQVVYVEHANSLEDAVYVAKRIEEVVKPKGVNISNIGPIIGASIGPDSITVNFYGDKVTIASNE